MPRAKLPEYFKQYKISIETVAETPAMALRFHKEKIDYHKRWIKGTLSYEDHDGEDTKYLSTTLYYLKGVSDEQPGTEET